MLVGKLNFKSGDWGGGEILAEKLPLEYRCEGNEVVLAEEECPSNKSSKREDPVGETMP